jgi:transcriptional regulator with XRE-family HTH domain
MRAARLHRHFSQEDLGERLGGLHQPTISDYENGKSCPDLKLIWGLMAVLGVEASELFPHDRFSHLSEQERTTLTALSTLPPVALRYILSFAHCFGESQQRRRFLSEEVFQLHDPRQVLRLLLERDVRHFETALQRGSAAGLLELLASFSALVLLGSELGGMEAEFADLVQRLRVSGQRLTDLVQPRPTDEVRA